MGGNYERDLFQQLQEVLERCDRIEEKCEHKIRKLNEKHREEIRSLKEGHREEIRQLKAGFREKIDALEKKASSLEKENTILKEDNERMKRRLSNNSTNSSLPPSSDEKPLKPANTYNGREKNGNRPGAQPGHKGKTLTKTDIEEKIKKGNFAHVIEHVGTRSDDYVVRYVIDVVTVPVATEVRIYAGEDGKYKIPERYRSTVTYGENLKTMVVDLYGEGVVSGERICAFISAVTEGEVELSAGSAYNFLREFAAGCSGSIEQIKDELLDATVLYTDATTVTVNGKQEYIRNQSTDNAVLYSPMKKKDIQTLKETGILSGFTGTMVTDHETAMYHFGTDHAECNVHLIRYNRKNTQETGNLWSAEMTELLCGINQKKKELMEQGIPGFSESELEAFSQKYDQLITDGYEQNKTTFGKLAQQEEKALLNRLVKYKHSHLLFAYRFEVGFSDNMSERDLRKCKNRQKMAGGFRKQEGKEMYCTILSIIETCKRKKMQIYDSIREIILGRPAIF